MLPVSTSLLPYSRAARVAISFKGCVHSGLTGKVPKERPWVEGLSYYKYPSKRHRFFFPCVTPVKRFDRQISFFELVIISCLL